MLLSGAGVLAYSSWLLEFVVPTGVSAVQDPVEDLFAGHPLFRGFLAVAGLAFLLAGPPLIRLNPVQWTGRLSSASVGLFGAVLLVDAAFPRNAVIGQLVNVVFIVGAMSLVLWWPPGWRRIATAGLVLLVLSWLAVVVVELLGPGHYAGVFTRVQLALRVVLMVVGVAYVVRTPVPRYAGRGA
jgi:hypothetical protein